MEIKEAREILKQEAIDKSNKEIEEILNLASGFADLVIEKAEKKYLGRVIEDEEK